MGQQQRSCCPMASRRSNGPARPACTSRAVACTRGPQLEPAGPSWTQPGPEGPAGDLARPEGGPDVSWQAS
eukprot:NODE_5311_length_717_cov_2.763473_g4467_i0.p5 GENE.NODE_5311_length_717_cov_2.763473_g4467_i0~~NODE_5311_length_717_cov_2.763473_g4467_i0.p5  ORF type:complete len:71 (-),score=4.37 NODE_5311_length_717_cov_2.763473_g4467_i0:87-299(-)